MVLTWGDADFGLTRVHDPADHVRVAETTAAGFSSPNLQADRPRKRLLYVGSMVTPVQWRGRVGSLRAAGFL
jgi:hypothetical protein